MRAWIPLFSPHGLPSKPPGPVPAAPVPAQPRSAATLEGPKSQLLAGKELFLGSLGIIPAARQRIRARGTRGLWQRTEPQDGLGWSFKLFPVLVSQSRVPGFLMETQLFLQCTAKGLKQDVISGYTDLLAPVCVGGLLRHSPWTHSGRLSSLHSTWHPPAPLCHRGNCASSLAGTSHSPGGSFLPQHPHWASFGVGSNREGGARCSRTGLAGWNPTQACPALIHTDVHNNQPNPILQLPHSLSTCPGGTGLAHGLCRTQLFVPEGRGVR